MSEKKNFIDQYKPVFEMVSGLLGSGWRVNLLDDCLYRIKLTSNQFMGFSIFYPH